MPANPNEQTENPPDTIPGLIFERFLEPGRISPPDIDGNFERPRGLSHAQEKS